MCQGGATPGVLPIGQWHSSQPQLQISQFTEKLVQNEIAKAMIARNDRLADPGEERHKVERGQIVAGFWRSQISLRKVNDREEA